MLAVAGRRAGGQAHADRLRHAPLPLPQPCSGRVIRATFNGEAVAAKEVDVGKGVAAHEAFITEAQRMHVSGTWRGNYPAAMPACSLPKHSPVLTPLHVRCPLLSPDRRSATRTL